MRRVARLVVVALLAAALPAVAQEPECKLVRVAEWPIRWVGGYPIVDGEINGERVNVMIHTAAYASLVTKDAAGRLRLAVSAKGDEVIAGRRGQTSDVGVTRIGELRIGNTTARNLSVRVAIDGPVRGVDFILGADFLSRYDIELDFAGGFIRAFEPRRCVGGNLAYWDSTAHRVGLEEGQEVNLPAKVSGRATTARLDTGYPYSQVQRDLAEKIGKAPGRLAPGCRANARVEIEIGNQVTRDAGIHVAPPQRVPRGFHAGPDLVLGNDFLKRHRILVSRSQATLYFSYLGGQVFTAPLLEPCDDRFPGKAGKEYLAALDAAIAANPRDTLSLIQAGVRRSREEPARAIVDLNAVLALEPGNALAYLMRVEARRGVKDYAGALADSDAALRLGAASADLYATRGRVRYAMGDRNGAIGEYEQALQLDPQHPAALGARGRLQYHEGRFEDAERDFAKVTNLRSDGKDFVWLALARIRRGQDANATLEEGVARHREGEWPSPVMRYLLGKLDGEALMAAAASSGERSRKGRACDANYYVAARLLAEGKRDEAKPLLQKAAEDCPRYYREYDSALTDLKAYDKPASAG